MSTAYQQQYRIGELPKWVRSEENSHNGHIMVPLGETTVLPGDWILYDADWNVIGVVRRRVMEAME